MLEDALALEVDLCSKESLGVKGLMFWIHERAMQVDEHGVSRTQAAQREFQTGLRSAMIPLEEN